MNKEEFITERTKIISEMLDNPGEHGIYLTTRCFEKLDLLYDRIIEEHTEFLTEASSKFGSIENFILAKECKEAGVMMFCNADPKHGGDGAYRCSRCGSVIPVRLSHEGCQTCPKETQQDGTT